MFLIANKEEFEKSNIEQFDFILISGDAYVDHPSFGVAIISRLLESKGFTVGIIAQPNWNDLEAFKIYGKPKYAFLVASGNIDSMVNHYTVAKKLRKKDYYTPNGEMGKRPDRATIVYSNKIKECYKDVPIILGGVEASLRRMAHYDYWDNKVRNSILIDSNADILVYGMGERQIVEIAECLKNSIPIESITYVEGTAVRTKKIDDFYDYIMLPKAQEVKSDKRKYGESFVIQYKNIEYGSSKALVEEYNNVFVVQNPPAKPFTTEEYDSVHYLPYERTYHPMYEGLGGIPAISEVKFSLISNRGCFGSCEFCAITFHQGRVVQARSHKSIIDEAIKITEDKDFKGYIHDVGGPTANFREKACKKQKEHDLGGCINKKCLGYSACNKLDIDHSDYVALLKKLRKLDKVKKVFVRSGIRYDYMLYDKNDEFFHELIKHHISGQLKVAPEHVSNKVLKRMGKPSVEVFNKFKEKYDRINKKYNMNQYLVPYLMSSHPGSDIHSAIELAEYLRDLGYMPEQVQDFYPTPSTLSTCIYYLEEDPFTKKKVYVPKSPREKAEQRALIQYSLKQNYDLVYSALIKGGREDLIGYEKKCLIRPKNDKRNNNSYRKAKAFTKDKKQNIKQKKKKTIRNTKQKKKVK